MGGNIDRELFDAALSMVAEELDPQLVKGPGFRIFCYKTMDGKAPAREFLELLPKVAQASYATSFKKHCYGHTIRGDKHRVWKDIGCERLAEYKDIPSKTRIVHVFDVFKTVVLLYGIEGKKEDRIPEYHINEARRRRDDYISRLSAAIDRLRERKRGI